MTPTEKFKLYTHVGGINQSGLKLIKRSPLHYWHAYLNPDRVHSEPSKSLRIGSAVDALVIGGEEDWHTEPSVYPDDGKPLSKYTKKGKAVIKEWKENLPLGAIVLTPTEEQTVRDIAGAVFNHPVANYHLFGDNFDIHERSECIVWKDESYDVECKALVDLICSGDWGTVVMDLKTTADASIDSFSKSIFNFGYHMQAAWYLRALRSKGDKYTLYPWHEEDPSMDMIDIHNLTVTRRYPDHRWTKNGIIKCATLAHLLKRPVNMAQRDDLLDEYHSLLHRDVFIKGREYDPDIDQQAHFVFIVVENTPPHGVALYKLSPRAIRQGDRECQHALAQYHMCLETGEWPGYQNEKEFTGNFRSIELPPWARW